MATDTKRNVNTIFNDEVVAKVKGKAEHTDHFKELSERHGQLERELKMLNGTADFLVKKDASKELDEVTTQLETLIEEQGETPDFSISPAVIDEMAASYKDEVGPIRQSVEDEYNTLLSMLDDVADQYEKVLGHQYKAVVLRTQLNTTKNLLSNPDNTSLPQHYDVKSYTEPGTFENDKDVHKTVSRLKARLNTVIKSNNYKGEK